MGSGLPNHGKICGRMRLIGDVHGFSDGSSEHTVLGSLKCLLRSHRRRDRLAGKLPDFKIALAWMDGARRSTESYVHDDGVSPGQTLRANHGSRDDAPPWEGGPERRRKVRLAADNRVGGLSRRRLLNQIAE